LKNRIYFNFLGWTKTVDTTDPVYWFKGGFWIRFDNGEDPVIVDSYDEADYFIPPHQVLCFEIIK
jgi:hypothetical protein